ncbi:oligoendopeptidase F family protein, partial [Staphylococcus pseudintermedius]|nr:oligoendopeptidase F family protein [Staphylococcus pseudintermedius]
LDNKFDFIEKISKDNKLSRLKSYYENLNNDNLIDWEFYEGLCLVDEYEKILYSDNKIGEFSYNKNIYHIEPNKLVFHLNNDDRSFRKKVYESVLEYYKEHENKAAFLINVDYRLKNQMSKNLGFENYFIYLMRLSPFKDMNIDIFEDIENVKELFKKNIEIRRKILNLKYISYYDLYYMGNEKSFISFEQAKELMLKISHVYGEQYVIELKKLFDSGNIHYESNNKKKFGARSYSLYSGYPHIIMNWNNDIDSLFILAHEIGGAMMQKFSKYSKSIVYAEPSELKTEVASIINELLLYEYLKVSDIQFINKNELDIKILEVFKDNYLVPMENINFFKKMLNYSDESVLDEDSISEIYIKNVKEFRFFNKFIDLPNNDKNWIKLHDQLNIEYNLYYIYAFMISLNVNMSNLNDIVGIFKKGDSISDLSFCDMILGDINFKKLQIETNMKVEKNMNNIILKRS